MDVNYYETLIAVAEDCPVQQSVVPVERGAKKTVATIQFELLEANPFVYTQADILFESWLRRQDFPELSEADVARHREAFFSKPQACMRTSPLPKKYGYGLRCGQEGRVALCPMESPEYQELMAGGEVKVVKAMRSKRA